MPLILFALFLCVPLIEIALFIQVGGAIGLWWTIAIVIITAIVGTAIVQKQGLNALQQGQQDMNAGRVPVSAMRDGAFIFMAGALLLTPGFLTDAVGFSLLIPPFRKWIASKLVSRVMKSANVHIDIGGVQAGTSTGQPPRNDRGRTDKGGPQTIDGEYTHVDEAPAAGRGTNDDTSAGSGSDSPWRR